MSDTSDASTASHVSAAIQALPTLPDDATIDDAIERLCLIAKIEEGLRQSEAGQLTDQEEVEKRLLA